MIASVTDCGAILEIINRSYDIKGKNMLLHRMSGAKVYYIDCNNRKAVFKLYRNIHTPDALQTIDIITYLHQNEYPCVHIIPTLDGKTHIAMDVQGEEGCVGVLFEFAEGVISFELSEVTKDDTLRIRSDFNVLGQHIGTLHRLMDTYSGRLLQRGKEYYIDRFIALLRRDKYDEGKTAELGHYGEELWSSMRNLPRGFCHGDLHTGNIIYTAANEYIILDWDMAAYSHSVYDVSRFCDGTDFNILTERSYDDTARMFETFYKGYSKEKNLNSDEIRTIYDCIAIVHYDLIATIVITNKDTIMHDFITEQFDWLMKWRKICEKKRN